MKRRMRFALIASVLALPAPSVSAGHVLPASIDDATQPRSNQPADAGVSLIDVRDLAGPLGQSDRELHNTMMALAEMVGAIAARVGDGVFAVRATPDQVASLTSTLDALRDMHRGHFVVDLVVLRHEGSDAPAIGARAPENAVPEARFRVAVREGVSASLEVGSTIDYISKWQPVVSDSSVGYDVTIGQVGAGLRATLSLAGVEGGVEIALTGSLARVQLAEHQLALLDDRSLPVQVPTTTTRSISAAQRVGMGELLVVNVVSGFEEGESIVVAVRVGEAR